MHPPSLPCQRITWKKWRNATFFFYRYLFSHRLAQRSSSNLTCRWESDLDDTPYLPGTLEFEAGAVADAASAIFLTHIFCASTDCACGSTARATSRCDFTFDIQQWFCALFFFRQPTREMGAKSKGATLRDPKSRCRAGCPSASNLTCNVYFFSLDFAPLPSTRLNSLPDPLTVQSEIGMLTE